MLSGHTIVICQTLAYKQESLQDMKPGGWGGGGGFSLPTPMRLHNFTKTPPTLLKLVASSTHALVILQRPLKLCRNSISSRHLSGFMENNSSFERMSTLLPLLQNLSQTLFKINI
jgi:hypothetical protein